MAVAVMRGTAPEDCLTLALKTSAGEQDCPPLPLYSLCYTTPATRPWPINTTQAPPPPLSCGPEHPSNSSGRRLPLPLPCPAPPRADLGTPMAPELGLFLDECYFEAYNRQWGEQHPCLRQAEFIAEVDAFKVGRWRGGGRQQGRAGQDRAGQGRAAAGVL